MIRLALLVHSLHAPAWIHRLIKKIQALDFVDVALIVDSATRPSPSPALTTALRLERRLLGGLPNPLALSPLTETLPNTPVLHTDNINKIQSLRVDILINCCHDNLLDSSFILHLSSFLPTWTWPDLSPAAGFHEVLESNPVTNCTLTARLPNGETKLIRQASFATDPLSAARNQNHYFIKAESTLLWGLKKLNLEGHEKFFAGLMSWSAASAIAPFRVRPLIWRPEGRTPTSFNLLKLFFKLAQRRIAKALRPHDETWVLLAAKRADGGLVADFSASPLIVAPRGTYWADPMPVEREGRVYLFAEEYVEQTKRGRIVCLTLDGAGQVESRQVALERPYHLSYPFIFEHDGETYMIPETAENRTVELYHCAHWPERWEFVHNLMSDIYAVDSTLLNHNGRWWLFANVKGEAGASSWDELHLFFADDPLSAAWTPHPLNPIVCDVSNARPAGPIFVHDGTLYRPAQDCSVRYGYAVNLNRIDALTETSYAETRVEKILPRKDFLATHTLSRVGGWTFVDGVVRIKKA